MEKRSGRWTGWSVGSALWVDHLEIESVTALVARIRERHGRLDVLVNDIFGGDRYAQWNTPLWRHDLTGGLRMGVHTYLITLALAMPLVLETGARLVVEITDGTHEYNLGYRQGVDTYYDLVKENVERIMTGVAVELETTVNPRAQS